MVLHLAELELWWITKVILSNPQDLVTQYPFLVLIYVLRRAIWLMLLTKRWQETLYQNVTKNYNSKNLNKTTELHLKTSCNNLLTTKSKYWKLLSKPMSKVLAKHLNQHLKKFTMMKQKFKLFILQLVELMKVMLFWQQQVRL